MHKINGPAQVKTFWHGQRSRATSRQPPFSFTPDIELEQAVNPVHPLVVPDMPLSPQELKYL